MKTYARSLLTLATLLVGAGLALATARPIADATIPFAFAVSATDLPAGQYEILVEDPSIGTLLLKNTATGKNTLVPFSTRLAMRDGDQDEMVFDRAGDKYYLSEIHISGSDGYFIPGAPGPHTHSKVKIDKKRN